MGGGTEDRDGKRKAKEKGEGREKGKKEDSNGDREGKRDIHWFPHARTHTPFLSADWSDFNVCLHNIFSVLTDSSLKTPAVAVPPIPTGAESEQADSVGASG